MSRRYYSGSRLELPPKATKDPTYPKHNTSRKAEASDPTAKSGVSLKKRNELETSGGEHPHRTALGSFCRNIRDGLNGHRRLLISDLVLRDFSHQSCMTAQHVRRDPGIQGPIQT